MKVIFLKSVFERERERLWKWFFKSVFERECERERENSKEFVGSQGSS